MLKNIIEKNENVTINENQIYILKKYFPSCFNNEGNFDVKKLEQVLNENGVDITKEGYELNFLGKSYAKLLTALESETVIKPDLEHNRKEENKNSENIYITGDNLDAIKHLLKSYSEEIKCIYIDPPYNTGNDGFVYMDNFKFTPEQLSEKIGISEDEAERILNMTSRGSASHSAWLTFMYPRLYMARDLLADEGVIFISIDDNEQSNLKILCDEIFGEENFIGNVIWKNATDNNPTNIATEHEHIMFYAKNKQSLNPIWKSYVSDIKRLLVKVGEDLVKQYGDTDKLKSSYEKWYKENKSQLWPLDRYKYIDQGGIYTGSQSVHNPGREGYRYDVIHPITKRPCKQPLMGYRFPEETMKKLLDDGKVLFGENENKIIELKVYAHEYEEKLSSVFELDGRLGSYDLKDLFKDKVNIFTNPKPVQLLQRFLSFISDKDDVILDFFSGSATTAHAVMKLNADDKGNRKYILVQIPEECKKGSGAYNAEYRTINEIGIERIKRAAEKIKNETQKDIDYGFKIYELASPQEKTIDKMLSFDPNKLVQDTSILTEFGIETVLDTWKVQDGYGFNAKLEEINLSGYTVYRCDNTLYFINSDIATQAIKMLIEKYQNDSNFFPNRIVLFGYSFNFTQLSQLKDNLKQLTDYRKIDVITRY